MPIVGRYEVLQELSRTGLHCIWSAKLADSADDARFVLKELRPAIEVLPGESFQPLVDSFLEQAELLKKLSDVKAQHWPPIHDLGTTERGAYFVTDNYPRSVAKLVRGRIKLSAG